MTLISTDGRIVRHTLTLTGSTAALIAAMQAFNEAEGLVDVGLEGNPAPSTPTGTGTPVAPVTAPSAPIAAAPIPTAPSPITMPPATASPDDEEGDETDGSGVDSAGLPWDERIHSSSRKRGKDGTWNKRRGGPSGAELAAIEAELRGQAAPVPPAPVTPVAPVPVAPPAPVAPLPPVGEPAPPAPPIPAPVAPTPAAEPTEAPAPEIDFAGLMQHIGPKMGEGEGQINQAYLAAVCQLHGLGSITDLAMQPEKIGTLVQQFQVDGRW